MTPILECVAKAYRERYADLSQICFLFPNKRCGVFLRKYLKEEAKGSKIKMPKIMTISDFVKEISGLQEADKIEAVFTLYDAYRIVTSGGLNNDDFSESDFDSFRGWAETVVSDFNTIDQYLLPPEEIFKNLKDFREISTDFLTEEQKEVMREYFGREDEEEISGFWRKFNDPDESLIKTKFLSIWQFLAPLHEVFTSLLEKRGLGTSGGIYRKAAELIEENPSFFNKIKKIVVFGFNALNGAEFSIFSHLRDMEGNDGYDDFADFIWDATGPVLTNNENTAARFVLSNEKHFPTATWLKEILQPSETEEYPEIKIISAPSNTFQVKIAGELLKEIKSISQDLSDSDMALILPDETLLINTLYSIPEDFADINLTMGYSFRQTGIASFMSLLRRNYVSMRENGDKKVFYKNDLKLLLSHPYATILFGRDQIETLLDYVLKYHKITLGIEEILNIIPDASVCLDLPSKKSGFEDIFQYIEQLINTLADKLTENKLQEATGFEASHLDVYYQYVKRLEEAMLQHQIKISATGILYLVDKMISSEKIAFEGEPLQGLQIMGTLETRGIDFKNVMIISMNEGMMPRRSRIKSFIPETLRRGYRLPPSRYSEEIFAYYFYRLISRAEKVTLIYDGRTGVGVQRGGVSRYVQQLRHFAPSEKISEDFFSFNLQTDEPKEFTIQKSPEIKKQLNDFLTDGPSRKNLSASSLNTYRECQIKFFLKNVLNINDDPSQSDFIDAITVGNILHEVMMELYLPKVLHRKLLKDPIILTPDYLNSLLGNNDRLNNLILQKINLEYYHLDERDALLPLPLSSEIIAKQILFQVQEIIKYDMNIAPIYLYGCEVSENINIKTKEGRNVNFRFAIDRLDAIEEEGEKRLRIIDYKTGQRKRKAADISEVLEGNYYSEQIFQLFTYAWLLDNYDVKGKEDVMTEIYFVPDLIAGERGVPTIGDKKVWSFAEYAKEFNEGINKMIDSIFNDDDFTMTKDAAGCRYCNFKRFCNK